ncbi:hypothetical protein Pla110_05560 [Polystyrenella longa]|uniref:Uncharacterized protein n=1 Tax=Polystyrenella longa TaxID=2528007 RepID=A0A518CHZ7_9PLAN|nr:hypothetical protein Pla110_05560 [Polystyrenella longa]
MEIGNDRNNDTFRKSSDSLPAKEVRNLFWIDRYREIVRGNRVRVVTGDETSGNLNL